MPSCGPISRGNRLKTGQLRVRVLPGGPWGRRSGRACRDPVLTGSCRHVRHGVQVLRLPPIFTRALCGLLFLVTIFPPCRPIRQDVRLSTGRPGGGSRRGGHFLLRQSISRSTPRERRPCGGNSRLEQDSFLDRKLCSEAAGFYPAEHGAAPWRFTTLFGGSGSNRFRTRPPGMCMKAQTPP